MKQKLSCGLMIMALLFFAFHPPLPAAEIRVGILYPMSGPTGQVGLDHKHAIELAMDIINTTNHKNLNLPLSKSGGLNNLGGAKVTVIFADHQGKPELGLSEAERLITQEKSGRSVWMLSIFRDGDRQHGSRTNENSIF